MAGKKSKLPKKNIKLANLYGTNTKASSSTKMNVKRTGNNIKRG